MTKSPVKALHALIDELNDAGKSELLTAMHTILMNQASAADADGDLELDNLDDDDDKPSKASKSKRRGGKAKDDDDDAGDDDEGDLDLGSLEVEDDDDDKPSKSKRRGGKAAADDDEDDDDAGDDDGDDAGDLPELKSAKGFNDFLDECDAFEFSPVDAGIRELTKRLQDEYGMNPDNIELPVTPAKLKKMSTKEIRELKSEVYGTTLAKFEHITEQLVELGEKGIAAVAKAESVDLDEVPGKGSRLVRNQALAIVGTLYAGDEDGDDDADEGDDE